jgi:hypothetical protein
MKTKRGKHKESRKHHRFRTSCCLIAKIFTTKVVLDTFDFMHKNNAQKLQRWGDVTRSTYDCPRDAIEVTQPVHGDTKKKLSKPRTIISQNKTLELPAIDFTDN